MLLFLSVPRASRAANSPGSGVHIREPGLRGVLLLRRRQQQPVLAVEHQAALDARQLGAPHGPEHAAAPPAAAAPAAHEGRRAGS